LDLLLCIFVFVHIACSSIFTPSVIEVVVQKLLLFCSYSTLPLDEEAEIIDDDRGVESDELESAANVS